MNTALTIPFNLTIKWVFFNVPTTGKYSRIVEFWNGGEFCVFELDFLSLDILGNVCLML